MAEWPNAPALKAGFLTESWVQIPVPPHSDANNSASTASRVLAGVSVESVNWDLKQGATRTV